ncbi:response regulator transcription factor, partial [Bacteroidota bacterium]
MTKPKILYVEDDETLSYITKENLEIEGFEVDHCLDGVSGYELYNKEKYDLCILDVMLPKLDGFELAKKIRKINEEIPIIFLTAKSAKEDKITGLKTGADDYITKPYSIEELILKIEVFLKRSKINHPFNGNKNILKIGDSEFNQNNLTFITENKISKLTYKEAELLSLLIQNQNKIISREDILIAIWGRNDYFLGRSLDVFISRLRKHLKNDTCLKIENIHGVGFKLNTLK